MNKCRSVKRKYLENYRHGNCLGCHIPHTLGRNMPAMELICPNNASRRISCWVKNAPKGTKFSQKNKFFLIRTDYKLNSIENINERHNAKTIL